MYTSTGRFSTSAATASSGSPVPRQDAYLQNCLHTEPAAYSAMPALLCKERHDGAWPYQSPSNAMHPPPYRPEKDARGAARLRHARTAPAALSHHVVHVHVKEADDERLQLLPPCQQRLAHVLPQLVPLPQQLIPLQRPSWVLGS